MDKAKSALFSILASAVSIPLSAFVHLLVGLLSQGFVAGYLIWTRLPESTRKHCILGSLLTGVISGTVLSWMSAYSANAECIRIASGRFTGTCSIAESFALAIIMLLPLSVVLSLIGGVLSPTIYKKYKK